LAAINRVGLALLELFGINPHARKFASMGKGW
jgi:hypothetical protein